MATRRKKKAEKTESIVLGFLGTGKVSKKAIASNIEDFIDARGGAEAFTFAVPINEDHWTNSMAEVATYAEDNEIPILAVHDGEEDNDPAELLEGEFKAAKAKDVPARIIKESDLIVFLWEDTEVMEELLDIALEKDIECFDLGDGLQALELEEVDEDDVPEDAVDDEDDADDEDDDEEGEEIDFATFDIDSLDVKEDRDRIMAIGEEMGVESYKGMRVGTMVKEIKKAQKVLRAQADDDGDDEPEAEAPAPKAKKERGSKKAEPETQDNAEVIEAEVLSTGGTSVSVVITLDADDLTDDTAEKVRAFLNEIV